MNEGYFKHILMGHVIFTLYSVLNVVSHWSEKWHSLYVTRKTLCRVTQMFVHFFFLFLLPLSKYGMSIVSHIFLGTWNLAVIAEFLLVQSLYCSTVVLRCWYILGTPGHILKLPRLRFCQMQINS